MSGWYLADPPYLPSSLEGATPGGQRSDKIRCLGTVTPPPFIRAVPGMCRFLTLMNFAAGQLDIITVLDPP